MAKLAEQAERYDEMVSSWVAGRVEGCLGGAGGRVCGGCCWNFSAARGRNLASRMELGLEWIL